jgi:hypothetical protein
MTSITLRPYRKTIPRLMQRYPFLHADQSATASDASNPQTASDRSDVQEETDESKNRVKTERRKKLAREKSLSHLLVAAGLNDTVISQLDNSCFIKRSKREYIRPPTIEYAHQPKYARFVIALMIDS